MPTNYGHLTKAQANDLFREIEGRDLDPSSFVWSEVPDTWEFDYATSGSPLVALKPKGREEFFFAFALGLARHEFYDLAIKPSGITHNGVHCVKYAPGLDEPTAILWQVAWSDAVLAFRKWLSALEIELNEPDLWTHLSGATNALLAVGRDLDNTAFSEREREVIQTALANLDSRVRSLSILGSAQYEDLASRIEYAREAANRVGRKDWLLVFSGTLLSYLTAKVPPQAGRTIWRIAVEMIQALWQHGGILHS